MTTAKYLEIADDLQDRIAKGEWARDGLLPTNRELAWHYQVSAMTPQLAKAVLLGRELVVIHQDGTFLTEKGRALHG